MGSPAAFLRFLPGTHNKYAGTGGRQSSITTAVHRAPVPALREQERKGSSVIYPNRLSMRADDAADEHVPWEASHGSAGLPSRLVARIEAEPYAEVYRRDGSTLVSAVSSLPEFSSVDCSSAADIGPAEAALEWQLPLAQDLVGSGGFPERTSPLAAQAGTLEDQLQLAPPEVIVSLQRLAKLASASVGNQHELSALAHVRRAVVTIQLDGTICRHHVIIPLLDGAEPCADTQAAKLSFAVDGSDVVVSSGAAGMRPGCQVYRSFGNLDNDALLVLFDQAMLDNPKESVALCGAFQSILRERELILPPGAEDAVTFIRDASALGPAWPCIPGPDAVDLASISLARWVQGQRSTSAGFVAYQACRQPLEDWQEEVAAWAMLAEIARRSLASLPTSLEHDEELLRSTRGADDVLLRCRLDAK
jgi:hypothetical protein